MDLKKQEAVAAVDTPVKGLAKGKGKVDTPASLSRGTRVSRRNRDTEDEWQQIPAEWLGNGNDIDSTNNRNVPSGSSRSTRGKAKTEAVNGDDESDLSELTDEEEHEAKIKASGLSSAPVSPVKTKAQDAMEIDEVSPQ